MKITPFGKKRDQDESSSISSFLKKQAQAEDVAPAEEMSEEPVAESPVTEPNVEQAGATDAEKAPQMDASSQKLEEIEKAIDTILGGPSLDNLMLLLTAIGMSKISISVSEDKTKLSISGVINLSEEDTKIKKEK